jgi:hypothetical protein
MPTHEEYKLRSSSLCDLLLLFVFPFVGSNVLLTILFSRALNLRRPVIWEPHRRFEGTYCLYLQGLTISQARNKQKGRQQARDYIASHPVKCTEYAYSQRCTKLQSKKFRLRTCYFILVRDQVWHLRETTQTTSITRMYLVFNFFAYCRSETYLIQYVKDYAN